MYTIIVTISIEFKYPFEITSVALKSLIKKYFATPYFADNKRIHFEKRLIKMDSYSVYLKIR